MELSPSEVRKLFMFLGDFTWITNEASSFRETTFNRRSDLVQKKKKKGMNLGKCPLRPEHFQAS